MFTEFVMVRFHQMPDSSTLTKTVKKLKDATILYIII